MEGNAKCNSTSQTLIANSFLDCRMHHFWTAGRLLEGYPSPTSSLPLLSQAHLSCLVILSLRHPVWFGAPSLSKVLARSRATTLLVDWKCFRQICLWKMSPLLDGRQNNKLWITLPESISNLHKSWNLHVQGLLSLMRAMRHRQPQESRTLKSLGILSQVMMNWKLGFGSVWLSLGTAVVKTRNKMQVSVQKWKMMTVWRSYQKGKSQPKKGKDLKGDEL